MLGCFLLSRILFVLAVLNCRPEATLLFLDHDRNYTTWIADQIAPFRPNETEHDRNHIEYILQWHWRNVCPYGKPHDGVEFTYGELTPNGGRQVMQAMGLYYYNDTETSVLYDLGSGVGKFVAQAALEHAAGKIVGVELDQKRHDMAIQAWGSVTAAHNISQSVEFRQGNVLETDLSDATHIFSCSLCFPESVIESLSRKILDIMSAYKTLKVVAALSDLPLLEDICEKKVQEIQVTWGRARVRIYSFQRS